MSNDEIIRAIYEEMRSHTEEMGGVKTSMRELLERIDHLEEEVDEIDRKVRSMNLTLENETNKNITIIAEGHLDLSRKLDEALKIDQEKEMVLLRLNHVEAEIKRIKEAMGSVA